MICKIFKRGKGSASGIDYLMSAKDAFGKPRNPKAELIRGDIAITKKLIASTKYAQKYTSGVLSWSENPDSMKQEQITQVIESFQNMVCAGLSSESVNWLWVKHQDKGRLELHFVIPNIELQTGKRFAPYFDRVDRPLFRAWERLTNAIYGFSNPADPELKRTTVIPPFITTDKKQVMSLINGRIAILAKVGKIKSRADVINELQTIGFEVTRTGKDYISIKDKAERRLRLRGGFFEENFQMPAKGEPSPGHLYDLYDVNALQATFGTQFEKRSRYMKRRFNLSSIEVCITENEETHAVFKEALNEGIAATFTSVDREHRANTTQPLRRIAITTGSIADSIELFITFAGKFIRGLTRINKITTINPFNQNH